MRKTLRLKLGSACNQRCTFCLSGATKDYLFNPAIIPYIKHNNYTRISYDAGEPFLYWNKIKPIIEAFPDKTHVFTTNGSVMTQDIVDTICKYNVEVYVSFSGYDCGREYNVRYDLLRQLPFVGLSVLYTGDKSLFQLDEEIYDFIKPFSERQKRKTMSQYKYNLMHTTDINDRRYTDEQIWEYIEGVAARLQEGVDSVMNHVFSKYKMLTLHFANLNRERAVDMRACVNPTYDVLTFDGRFMDCSYNDTHIGTIDTEEYPDYRKIQSQLPERCRTCELNRTCGESICFKSVVTTECDIYRTLNRRYNAILQEKNVNNETIYSKIRGNT